MSRILVPASCTVALVWNLGLCGVVSAQPPGELKQLDKLEGYEQLPGEKKVKQLMEAVPKQPVETLIVWSEGKPTSGAAPLAVEFSVDPPQGAKNPKCSWDFGDGSPTAQGIKVSHTYGKPGVYRALLKLTDDTGDLGGDEQRIKVTQ